MELEKTVKMKNTKIYKLPFDQTLSYFLSHIGCGKSLSEAVCKDIDFIKGEFFTILPELIDPHKLLEFECGGTTSKILLLIIMKSLPWIIVVFI